MRDFFPQLATLTAQEQVKRAVDSGDDSQIEFASRRMRDLCTPTPRRRAKGERAPARVASVADPALIIPIFQPSFNSWPHSFRLFTLRHPNLLRCHPLLHLHFNLQSPPTRRPDPPLRPLPLARRLPVPLHLRRQLVLLRHPRQGQPRPARQEQLGLRRRGARQPQGRPRARGARAAGGRHAGDGRGERGRDGGDD